MKNKKVHLNKSVGERNFVAVCSGVYNTYPFDEFYNLPKEQQCKNCMKTKYYQEQEQKMENERKASSDELGYEVLDYEVKSDRMGDITYLTLCPYGIKKLNNKTVPVGSHKGICSSCDYFVSHDKKLKKVKCSFKAKNKPKTQLELDTIKYNLNAEHVEILSKVDYEVVDATSNCQRCVLKGCDSCDGIKCDTVDGDKQIIFKQVHKTQESLNESIEKESLREGIEDPFEEPKVLLTGEDAIDFIENGNNKETNIVWNTGVSVFDDIEKSNIFTESMNELASNSTEPTKERFEETKQESKHYQNGLETIQKIKSTLDNLEGEITLFQAYCMGNIIKYEDRAGLKDDKDKDLYKASDYTAMMINNNWIGK